MFDAGVHKAAAVGLLEAIACADLAFQGCKRENDIISHVNYKYSLKILTGGHANDGDQGNQDFSVHLGFLLVSTEGYSIFGKVVNRLKVG